MEFRDLKHQYHLHKAVLDKAMLEVVESAGFISGKQVKELENRLAEYVGVKHCVSCANGTDALQLALMVWKIGPGDAVFVPDFTFFSSGEVVSALGATPVFVDIDEDTYNISAEDLERAVQKVLKETKLVPKAVVAVDLFGQPADYDKIRKVTNQYQLYLLEDGAQGFGGSVAGKKACSFGDISTTSFFPAKPLGCYGDGGALFTDNDEYAQILRSLCVHGKGSDKYDNIRIGMNSRLDTLQAAVLLAKMDFFEDEIAACNIVADQYTRQLTDIVKTPKLLADSRSGWAQYTVCFESMEQRDAVMGGLREAGIPSAVYYKKPMHQQRAFAEQLLVNTECKVSEKVCNSCLSLPMHPYLQKEEIELVCNTVRSILNGK